MTGAGSERRGATSRVTPRAESWNSAPGRGVAVHKASESQNFLLPKINLTRAPKRVCTYLVVDSFLSLTALCVGGHG